MALLSIITLGVVAYVTQRNVLEQQFSAELNSVAAFKEAQIVSWFAERKSDVTFLSENQLNREQLAALLFSADDQAMQADYARTLRETLRSM
ncbi:MAG: hypothetical protein R2932_50670 [Caldilineaceae bacterium]